ncbi:MAG: penicillin-binding protein activator [Pseudoruegeria sp.]
MFPNLKFKRRTFSFAILPAALLALASCEPVSLTGGGGGPSINTNKPVQVALLVPKGSGQASDQQVAQSLENAARMAMGDLDGVTIDLRVYDTAGSANQSAAVAAQAVNDGAKIILGPLYAQSANAAGLATASSNVNVLAFSNNTEIAGGNVYVLGNTFENTANRIVSYAKSQGKTNHVVVQADNAAGNQAASAIQKAAGRYGASVGAVIKHQFSQQGVVDAVPAIKTAVTQTGATSILFTSDTAGALSFFAQLLPEAGVDPSVTQYMGLTRWDIPSSTLEMPGVQGGWFALPDPTLRTNYNTRYSATYGSAPHPVSGLAYDGIAAIGASVKAGRADALAKSGLTQSKGFAGVNGIFRFLPDGTNERAMAIAEIQNKQVTVIDSAPKSFGGGGF